MKLGFVLRSAGSAQGLDMPYILEMERLGYDSVWTGEAYGSDVVTPIAWILARTTKLKGGTGIMQMAARTPTAAAMTAMTLHALSGGRFLCGIGPSGPQVVEGWHGEPFGKPLMRTKEYVSIMRKVFAREAPLTHQGEHYQIPYMGAGSTGLGRPLKSVMPASPDIKIYTAAIAPAGLRTGGEVADGGLPFFMSPEKTDLIVKPILDGMAKAPTKKTLADFDVAPYVRIRMGDDIEAARDELRSELALYIGGMGARDKNFYNDLARRMGYEGAAKKVQDLFLDGKRREAAAAVPNELIDEMSLIGSASRIKDRLQAWKSIAADGRVGTMVLSGATIEAARIVAEAVL